MANDPEPFEYLTAEELADRFRVSTRTIRRWSATGLLPSPLAIGGVLRWSAEDMQTWDEWQAVRRDLRAGGYNPEEAGATFREFQASSDRSLFNSHVNARRGT